MRRRRKNYISILGLVAMIATVLSFSTAPASATLGLRPGVATGNGIVPTVVDDVFASCSAGTEYTWDGTGFGTQTSPEGVEITVSRSAGPLPGRDSRYFDVSVEGGALLEVIVFSNFWIWGYYLDGSNVYSFDPATTADTNLHAPTVSSDRPNKRDGMRFCYDAASADLSITKSVDEPNPDNGDTVTYSLAVTNTSAYGTTATGVTVTDTLPGDVDFAGATDGGSHAGGVVTWNGLSIAAGETRVLALDVTVDEGAPGGIPIVNSAAVTPGDEPDPDLGNNTAEASLTVNPVIDLSVEMSVDTDIVFEGETVLYTVTVSNLSGNTVATTVTVSDTLPAGLTLVGTSGCAEDDTGGPTCTLPDIPVGGSESYDISTTVDEVVPPSADLTNTASVTATETDTDGTNNTSDPLTIVATPALSCGVTVSQADVGYASDFTRLNLGEDALDGCVAEPSKPYFQDIVDNADIGGDPDGFRFEFEPQGDAEDEAIYRGVLTFPAGLEGDFRPSLRYDENGFTDETISFADMQGCIPTLADSVPLTALAAEFSGELPAGIYPDMPAGESACSVSVSSVIGGIERWVIRVDYDPWFRR